MDLTEAEDIKKRWQEYTEELDQKDLHDPDGHDGVITHLEPDILEWEIKWKAGLKLNIQKTKIMAYGPITSWQIDGETMETVTDFIFLGSKILQMVTAAMKLKDACSLEEKL